MRLHNDLHALKMFYVEGNALSMFIRDQGVHSATYWQQEVTSSNTFTSFALQVYPPQNLVRKAVTLS